MYSVDIASWLKTATEKIRFRRDRIAVQYELRQHMEDKWKDLQEQGLPEKEIEQRILADMGSAKELAPLLAEIHKPHLGYTMVILKWVMIATLLITFFLANAAYGRIGHLIGEDHFSETEVNDGTFSRINMVEPNVDFSCDQYYFTVQKAALWEFGRSIRPSGEVYNVRYALHLEIRVMKGPFMPAFQGWKYFWAEDDQGNIYRSEENPPNFDTDGYVNDDYSMLTRIFYDLGYISLSEIYDPNIQWIDLHFDADGRDVTVRIDLSGGESA